MNELNQAYLGCSVMLDWKLSWELLVDTSWTKLQIKDFNPICK